MNDIFIIEEASTFEEQIEMFKKWNLMNYYQKKISDEKSIKLFGCDNMTHHKQILEDKYPNRKFDILYERILASNDIFNLVSEQLQKRFLYSLRELNDLVDNLIIIKINDIVDEQVHPEVRYGGKLLKYIKKHIDIYPKILDYDVFLNLIPKNWSHYEKLKSRSYLGNIFIFKYSYKNIEKVIDKYFECLKIKKEEYDENDYKHARQLLKNKILKSDGCCFFSEETSVMFFNADIYFSEVIIFHEVTHFMQFLLGINMFNEKIIDDNDIKSLNLTKDELQYVFNEAEFWTLIYNNLYNSLIKIYKEKYKKECSWNLFITKYVQISLEKDASILVNTKIWNDWMMIIKNDGLLLRMLAAMILLDKNDLFKNVMEKLKEE